MIRLDTQIDLDLPRFFRWWFRELVALIPPKARQLLIQKRPTLEIRRGADSLLMALVDEDSTRILEPIALSGEAAERWQEHKTQTPEAADAIVSLMLTAGQCLHRQIKLPAAAAENLTQVVAFELDRLTPFKPDQVYFATHILERLPDSRQIRVALALTPKSKLDPLLDELAAIGCTPDRVGVDGVDAAINLLPPRFRRRENRLPQILTGLLGVSFLALLIATLVVPVVTKHKQVQALQQEIKRVSKIAQEVETLKGEAERLGHESGFLLRKKRDEPAMVDMLEELTKVMPDQTWLNGLQYRDRKLILQGQSPAASSLIERIEKSPFFNNTSFVSPVTKDVTNGLERFQIAIEVINGRTSEKPSH